MKLLPFNNYNLKTSKILETLNNASRSLAELKGFANSIPNQHILINAITINEAKDSSAIENIVTTHDSIYKVLTESGFREEAAKEVVDYRSAIWRGYEIIKEKGFISTNILVDITKLNLSLTGKTKFKIVEAENPKDDFSNISIKTINVFEFDAEVKKQNENKIKND